MALFKTSSGPVLLLGEGDFSFSVALQKKHPKLQLVSSSFLDEENVQTVHKNSARNISTLKDKGKAE